MSLRELGIAWSVVSVEQVGLGSVAWIALSPCVPDLSTCGARGRGEGVVARTVRFGETGQVPEIEVENLADQPVLIPAYLVVTGGWQTRAVERSVVVPARASARVPVKCVEAGRWAPRDEKTAGTFEVLERTALRTRWSTSINMLEQLQRHGRFAAEQSAIWQHVEEELSRSPEPSHTRSYEAYLRGVKRQHKEAAQKAAIKPPEAANAVVLFPRGGGFWLEAYSTPEALAEQADDLLADLFDGAAAKQDLPPAPNVAGILRLLWPLKLRPVERVAGTLGSAYALACRLELGAAEPRLADPGEELGPTTSETTGAALAINSKLAHLSIGGAPPRAAARPRGDAAVKDAAVAAAPVEAAGDPPRPDPAAMVSSPMAREGSGAAEPRFMRERILDLGAVPMPPVNDGGSAGEPRFSQERPFTGGGAMSSAPRASEPSIVQERPKIGRDAMRAIYARARDLLPFDPPAAGEIHGYRLMRVLEGNVSWVDIRIVGDGYAVLGSHDRCDLVLASDAGIWLRHMIAICVRLEDDTVGLRLIDLKTDIPFFLEDDVPVWSVTATGAFAIRLGRHVICGFPIGQGDEDAAADPQLPPASMGRMHTFESLSRSRAAAMETSAVDASIPIIRPLRLRDEPFTIVPSAPVSQIQELIGPSASPNHVRVTLERGGMGASVEIPTEALDAGVLLGRALNCFDGGLRRIFCDAVSRAHVLLLREREEVHAIDLCTTNGTRVAGRRIRRYRLSNDGSTLELGKKVVFRWHRRRTPEAPPPAATPGPNQPGERQPS